MTPRLCVLAEEGLKISRAAAVAEVELLSKPVLFKLGSEAEPLIAKQAPSARTDKEQRAIYAWPTFTDTRELVPVVPASCVITQS